MTGWRDPLAYAATLAADQPEMVLLYSGMRTSYSGRYSYLAWDAEETVAGEDFAALEAALKHSPKARWFGYFGYALRHALEDVPRDPPSVIALPALRFTRFRNVLRFDHERREVTRDAWLVACKEASEEFEIRNSLEKKHNEATTTQPTTPRATSHASRVTSTMTKAEYLDKIAHTLRDIEAGNFYQANITRKFYGEMQGDVAPFEIFKTLCDVSPAPYSAYIKCGDAHILSSSPELFLRVSEDGAMESRPIKGSLGKTAAKDTLATSTKDRAENLMIVDLMRNDFSRVAEPGSVEVTGLFEVDSFATIHHMSSTVKGKLKNSSPLAAIQACFPPGSMTGAPKIAAMRWCSAMEGIERGVYSGALGWVSGEACELSVVIRTLVLSSPLGGGQKFQDTPERSEGGRGNFVGGKNGKTATPHGSSSSAFANATARLDSPAPPQGGSYTFEFQVGGGIVADSVPEAEWRETMDKARGVCAALGIPMARLEAL